MSAFPWYIFSCPMLSNMKKTKIQSCDQIDAKDMFMAKYNLSCMTNSCEMSMTDKIFYYECWQ